MNRLCAGLQDAYIVSQLSFPYTLTHIPAVGVTSVEVHSPTPLDTGDRGATDADLAAPVLSEASTPPKESLDRSEKVHR